MLTLQINLFACLFLEVTLPKSQIPNFIVLLVQQSCKKMFSLNQFFRAIKYASHLINYENIFLKVKQYQILESVLLKRNTIKILATGYGKSVIFHLIPFAADYLCKNRNTEDSNIVLIITPLNAIIDDQILILQKHGIKATMLRADTITSLQLGKRGRHIGGIDTRTGVTLQLIDLRGDFIQNRVLFAQIQSDRMDWYAHLQDGGVFLSKIFWVLFTWANDGKNEKCFEQMTNNLW